MKCWAAALGDCNQIQSGEHIVSESIAQGPTVTVEGTLWPKGPITIGWRSLKSNTLCSSHNSRLSPFDKEAGRVFKELEGFYKILGHRTAKRPQPWVVWRYRIDGQLFERWLMKTAINIQAAAAAKEWWNDSGDASFLNLLRVIFEGAPLPFPAGMYARIDSGTFEIEGGVEFRALTTQDGDGLRFAGGFFVFRGARFLIWLDNTIHPRTHPQCVDIEALGHRPRVISHEIAGFVSQTVEFSWL